MALDYKSYMYGLIIFGMMSVICFGLYGEMVSVHGGASLEGNVSNTLNVIEDTNELTVSITDSIKNNQNSQDNPINSMINAGYTVMRLILNGLTFPFRIMTAMMTDMLNIRPDMVHSSIYTIISALFTMIAVALALITVGALFKARL